MRQRVDRTCDERYLTTIGTLLLLQRILETQYRPAVVPIGFQRHVLAVEECPIGIGDRQMALGIECQLFVMDLKRNISLPRPSSRSPGNDQFGSRAVHRLRASQGSREEGTGSSYVLRVD